MVSDKICPNCEINSMSTFYEVLDVPVNSAIMSSREQALQADLGDIKLGFCDNCGFISNLVFDASKLDYSTLYPEEQSFSPTFIDYINKLAKNLIEKYDLHGKKIVEIGCGKGDFLALLCELGNNYGVGIDPSQVAGNIQSIAKDRLTFIHEYYSTRHSKYVADFVSCRHTLEHIKNTALFMKNVRFSMNRHLDTPVFFEVPDAIRVLTEVAFWDIYYEHCSYFSAGSLAQLFRGAKFDVTSLTKGYFDQYLLMEARPAAGASKRRNRTEENVRETAEKIQSFRKEFKTKLSQWKDRLRRLRTENTRAVVWGSGSKCIGFMTTLGVKEEIEYVVDINPNRHGKFIPVVGTPIVPPEFLKKYEPEIIIVMNPVYCAEIAELLRKLEVTAELVPCI